MDPERWRKLKSIVGDALARDPDQRVGWAQAQCAGEEELLEDVLSLMDAADVASELYETPCLSTAGAALAAFADDPDREAGTRIGAYEVLSEIGHGGMGTVYLAARADDTFDKRVAIKVIRRGIDTDTIVQRFRRERQILASLDHPNIVMLLDGGTTEDGRPYFVMEYVNGIPIDQYNTERQLSVAERLSLFRVVCEAVQYAHDKRILHRDLKPGNILVTDTGVPKLLDFGIARLFDAAGAQTREPTLIAHAMTPRYASPEQIRGETVTPASDIYALGVLLYELVSGKSPYAVEGRSAREVERLVCESEPASLALPRRIGRDLDTVVLTALAKQPAARFATAAAFADDVGRLLANLPVNARRPRRRVWRRRFPAAAAMLVVAAGLAWLLWRAPDIAAPPRPPALVVLPFAEAGGDPALEYLAEGLAEDVIYRLSQIPDLTVIARDTAFRYRGAGDPVRIGRELGARYVLSGRVVREDDRIAVTAELIDAQTERQLWGQRFAHAAGDVQAMQAELAGRITASLPLAASTEAVGVPALLTAYTTEPRAYESWLRGRYFWNKRTPAAFKAGVVHYRQAVNADPGFALAYVGLADTYSLLTEYHHLAAAETYPLVQEAIDQALALVPELPEAHVSRAYFWHFYEWNVAAAESEFRRALEAQPRYVTGRQWYAEFLASRGQFDEALAEIRLALALDPLSPIVNVVQAKILYLAGRNDEALAALDELLAMDPQFPEAWEYVKRTHDQRGSYRDAIVARQTRRRLLGLDTNETSPLAVAAEATNAPTYWRARLEQELLEARTEGFLPFELAELHAQAGDTAEALDWLRRACQQHDFLMVYAAVMPNLAPLRGEPEFAGIIERGCAVVVP